MQDELDDSEPRASENSEETTQPRRVSLSWRELAASSSEFSPALNLLLGRAVLDSEFRGELCHHVSPGPSPHEVFEHEAAYLQALDEVLFERAMIQLKAELSETLKLCQQIEAHVVAEAEAWTATLEALLPDDENPEELTESE